MDLAFAAFYIVLELPFHSAFDFLGKEMYKDINLLVASFFFFSNFFGKTECFSGAQKAIHP